ncbi:hypothetical protein [Bremerella alba]|nr:hypothetical protein [Bremerella alba]
MTDLLFIDDGYTHEACLAAVPGLHAALVFTYRPMTHEARDQVAQAVARQTSGTTATELLAHAIAAHVTTWNASCEVSADEIQKLVPGLFDKVYAILAGARPSDPLPDTGQVPEAYQAEADLKN